MKSRIWRSAFVVLLVVLLAGCGPAAPVAAPAATQAPAAAKAAPAAPAGEELSGELTLWGGYPEMKPLYEKAIAEFTAKNPKVKISFLTHPLREYEQKLGTSLPVGTGPDIMEGYREVMMKFYDANLVPEVPQWVLDRIKGWHDPVALEYLSWKGKQMGIPFFEGRSAIFYNSDCFKEAGLAEPAADKPVDWATFENYIQKTAKQEGGKVTRAGISHRLSGGGSGITQKFWTLGMPNGLQIVTQKGNKWVASVNSDAGLKTLKLYIDSLYKWKADSPDLKHDAEGFELAQACMFQRETWVIGDIAAKAPNLKYGTMPLPKGSEWNFLRTNFGFFVSKEAKNPKLAWEFVLFLLSPENQKYTLDNIGWLPSRVDVDYSELLAKKPAFKAFMVKDTAYKAQVAPPLPVFDEILTKMGERLTKVYLDQTLLDNEAGMKKALDELAAEANGVLKREGLLAE